VPALNVLLSSFAKASEDTLRCAGGLPPEAAQQRRVERV